MAAPFVYLASQSPRRRELLTQCGVAHEVIIAAEAVDETVKATESPAAYVRRVARAKAASGWQALRSGNRRVHPLVAADTTVAISGRILGKPESPAAAAAMLALLAGSTHQVLTAVAVAWKDGIELALSESSVTMRALTDEEIVHYVGSGESMDKAGGYAVQGRAAIFIERIEGSYSGVMGLPLFETAKLLSGAGLVLL